MREKILNYGIALLEKECVSGLDLRDITLLYGLIGDIHHNGRDEVYPIELEAKCVESSAMGFISKVAAEALDYDYEGSGLHDFISLILDDMNNEREDKHYVFKGIDIYLSR